MKSSFPPKLNDRVTEKPMEIELNPEIKTIKSGQFFVFLKVYMFKSFLISDFGSYNNKSQKKNKIKTRLDFCFQLCFAYEKALLFVFLGHHFLILLYCV